MRRKMVSCFRALFVLILLLTSQAQMVLAADKPEPAPAAPASAASNADPAEWQLPFRQNEFSCKTWVNTFIVTALPPTGPDIAQAGNAVTPYGATLEDPALEHEVGDVVKVLTVIQNVTGSTNTPPNCTGTPETLTSMTANLALFDGMGPTFPYTSITLNLTFPGEAGTLPDGQIAWSLLNYTIPSTLQNNLVIDTRMNAMDAATPTPNLVEDTDSDDTVIVVGPGFRVVSFNPEVSAAAPGAFVNFTIIIQNTRGTAITAIGVVSPVNAFIGGCHEPSGFSGSKWVESPGQDPIPGGQIVTNALAECTFSTQIPADPAPESFSVMGELTATDTNLRTAVVQVTSAAVNVNLPAIAVQKTVNSIKRGAVVVQPPAAIGDVISYDIVVENTGEIPVNNILINDSLTGPIFISPSTELLPGEELPVTATYVVQSGGQDPLANQVTVTALGTSGGQKVNASAVATVDILDSALEVDLQALDPATGDPVTTRVVGQTIRYAMVLHNSGTATITGISYVNLTGSLYTFGAEPNLNNLSLTGGETSVVYEWLYTIADLDPEYNIPTPDPLISTVKVKGTANGTLVFAQDAATVDLTSEDFAFSVILLQPTTPSVLRGSEVVYQVSVANLNGTAPICNVRVDQYRIDPDTGLETLIVPNLPLAWPGTPGQLAAAGTSGDAASGLSTYLVTGQDKDPLHMVFKVTATTGCPTGGTTLSDRTSIVLDISEAQVNASLVANLGSDNLAEVGETITFTYLAQNVGTVLIRNLAASYCLPTRTDPIVCDQDLSLTRTSLGSFEDTTGSFDVPILAVDADANPFVVLVTLTGLDQKGNNLSIVTSLPVQIASDKLKASLTGPASAVVGDNVNFLYSIVYEDNPDSTVTLQDVVVYDMRTPTTVDDPADIYNVDHAVVGTYALLYANSPVNGSFFHRILQSEVEKDIYTQRLRVKAKIGGSTITGTAELDVTIVPIIGVLKTGPTQRIAGQEVQYDITITNNSVEQTVTLTDVQDSVLEASPYNIPVNVTDFVPSVLSPGQNVSHSYTIPAVEATPTPLLNIFVATGTRSYDGASVSGSDDWSIEIGCPIGFLLDVQNIDDRVAPMEPDDVLGEWLRWNIRVVNITDSAIDNIVVTDTLGSLNVNVGTLASKGYYDLPAFERQITNQYYGAGEDFMGTTLTATFSGGPGMPAQCVAPVKYQVYSPIYIMKLPDPIVAFTGETVRYHFYLGNVTEMDDPPEYEPTAWYINQVSDPMLVPNPIPFDFNRNGSIAPNETAGALPPTNDDPLDLLNGPLYNYIDYEIQPADPDELTNTVTAEFPDPADPDFTFYTWWDAVVYTGDALEIKKVPSTTQASPGVVVTYDYSIQNVSPYLIQNITFVDDRIGDLTPLLTTQSLNPGDPPILIEGIEYTIKVNDPDPVTNTATAEGDIVLDPAQPPKHITSAATASVDLIDPDVTIDKYPLYIDDTPLPDALPVSQPDGQFEGHVGENIKYCFTLTNNNTTTGPDRPYVGDLKLQDLTLDATGVALQSQFEAALDALGTPYGPRYVEVDGVRSYRLYAGETVTFCFGTPRQLTRALGDPVLNTVVLDGVASSGAIVHDEDEAAIDLLGTDIMITKIPSQPLAFVGEEITYTIRIENGQPLASGSNITDIVVTDTFQSGVPVELDLAEFDWSHSGIAGTPDGELAPGGYALYTYSYTIQSGDPDPLENAATVEGILNNAQMDPVEDSTRAVLAVTESQLLVRKTASPSIARPGDEVTYTISIVNVGQIQVQDIVVDDVQYGTSTHYEGVIGVDPGGALTDDTLDPFVETAFITYTATMPDAATLALFPDRDPYINTVTVTGKIFDGSGQPLPDVVSTATASVDILQPNVRISKSPEVEASTPGGNVLYTITITNIGGPSETLEGLIFTDIASDPPVSIALDTVCAVPADCTFRYGPEPYTDSDGNGTLDQANPLNNQPYDPAHGLQSREQLTGTIQVVVPDDFALSEFTNVVEIRAHVRASSPSKDVIDRASATIDIRDAGILVEKTANMSSAPVGANVTYTVRVTNVGGVPIDRLVISDPGMNGASTTITVENGFPDTVETPSVDDSGTLDPEEEYVLPSYQHTITATDPDPYVNRVTVMGYTARGAVLNVAEATVDVQAAGIQVDKFACVGADTDSDPATINSPCQNWADVSDATPDTVTYYLHFRNLSMVALESIEVADTLAPASTFASITWPAPNNGLAADDGVAGGADELWFMYTRDVQPGDADPLANLVTASASVGASPIRVQDTATAQIDLVTSMLQLTKTGPATATVGSTVTYSFTVRNLDTNTGGTPITDINIVDPLSGSQNPICTIASVPPNSVSTTTCQFNHVVTLADNSPLVNTAVATGRQGSVTVTDTATHSLDIVTPGLSVTKTADRQVARIGDTVTYTYEITNTGTVSLTNIVVDETDPLITDASYQPSAWLTSLPVGQTMVRTATHVITAQDPDPYINTFTVTGMAGTTPLSANASETVYIANGNLVVSNMPSANYVVAGGTVTFTYTITNLSATDTLDTIVATDGLCDTALATQLTTQLPSGQLGPGVSVTLFCTVTAQLPGPVVSTFYVQANDSGTTVFDSATAEVQVITGGVLVTKTANKTVVDSTGTADERTITYTVEVTNVGTEPLDTFTITDSLMVPGPITVTTLQPNESFIITYPYVVPNTAPIPDSVTNTVTVQARGATSSTPANPVYYTDSDSASVAVTNGAADLVITKEVSRARVAVNGTAAERTLTYTFQIRNVSTNTVTDITLDDTLVSPTAIAVPDLAPGNVWTTTRQYVVQPTYTLPTLPNTATVYAGGDAQDSATATVEVQVLSLTKTAPASVTVGSSIQYTLTATNLSTATIPAAGNTITINDPLLSAAPINLTIPAAGLPAGGTLQVIQNYPVDAASTATQIDNTATLYMNNVLQDTRSVSVAVMRTGIEVTIPANGIVQYATNSTGGQVSLTYAQTGEPVEITFVIRNTGADPLTNVTYTVGIEGFASATCQQISPAAPAPFSLAGGASQQVTCRYIPPVADASYRATDGLVRDVTVTVAGTAGATTVNDTTADQTPAAPQLRLVDLRLQALIVFLADPVAGPVITTADPGDTVYVGIQLTNLGASRLGCTNTEAPEVAGELPPCHLSITPNGGVDLATLLTPLQTQIQNTVLNGNDGTSNVGDEIAQFVTAAYTVPATGPTITFGVAAVGGYYTVPAEITADLLPYYMAIQASDSETLTVQSASLSVTMAANPIPPIFGQSITYTVTFHNNGNVPIRIDSDGVVAGGGQPDGIVYYQFASVTASAGTSGLELMSNDYRQTSPLTVSPATIPAGGTATATLAKTEDRTSTYAFIVTYRSPDISSGTVQEARMNLTPSQVTTATATGTITPTVDPSTLDPNATEPTVTKTTDVDTVQLSGAVAWVVTVRNGSTTAMSNVIAQDAVPSTLNVVSATSSKGTTVTDGRLITVTIGSMQPGETATITVNTMLNETATSPSTISNTACAQRQGGTQVCETASVSVGASVENLPSTGIRSETPGLRLDGLFGILLVGALMLLMGAQPQNRRLMLVGLFLLVAVIAVAGAVIVLVTGGEDEEQPAPTQAAAMNATVPALTETPLATVPAGGMVVEGAWPTATPQPTYPMPTVEGTRFPVMMQFPATATPYSSPTPGGERYLLIPKLADQFEAPIPIVNLPIVDRHWDVSGLGYYVGWLEGTNWLEQTWGNTVLVAHVQLGFHNPGPFWGLGELVPGDEIVVMEGGNQTRYVVTSTQKVDPEDWTVTAPTTSPILTLITCTEWDRAGGVFSQRMVVQAIPAQS